MFKMCAEVFAVWTGERARLCGPDSSCVTVGENEMNVVVMVGASKKHETYSQPLLLGITCHNPPSPPHPPTHTLALEVRPHHSL